MSRQVDLKALVSHVIRGDGINKCRICMGDTSEGQVHLSDTVMMDGEKPVTLSELLETVTGIQVRLEVDLPAGVCLSCFKCALNAAEFRTFCYKAVDQWEIIIQLLNSLPSQCSYKNKIFAIIERNQMIINNLDTSNLLNNTNRQSATPVKLEVQKVDVSCQCPHCGKEFHYAHQLNHHLKYSPDLKQACQICAKIMNREDLVLHLVNEHDREPYICKECPALLFTDKQYRKHLVVAHSEGFACIECGRSFQSQNAYHAHVSVHSAKSCPSCDKLFPNHSCYIYHVQTCCDLDRNREDTIKVKNKVMIEVNNKINNKKIKVGLKGSVTKKCICDYCKKTFAAKKFVAAHIQIVHTRTTHKPCEYCGKLLAAAHMTEHVKSHELDRSFTCEHCKMVLKTKLGFSQHLRLHTGEKPYACSFCTETFSASSRRSEHIRKVHKSSEIVLKHGCHLCPAKFRLPYRLKKHLKAVHNDDKDSIWYECDVCKETFGSGRGLQHHSRIHQNIGLPVNKPEKYRMRSVFSDLKDNVDNMDVVEERELPGGLCCICTESAMAAWQFKRLCQESHRNWTQITLLSITDQPKPRDRVFYATIEGTVVKDHINNINTITDAAKRLNFLIGNSQVTRPKYKKKNAKTNVRCKCKDCGKEFSLPYFLNRHLINTRSRACTLCGKVLPREKLVSHLQKSHHKLVENCKVCYRLFDDQQQLNRHRDLHGENDLQCKVCKYCFKNERSLRAHAYTHTLFNCVMCNASFESRKCYLYHKNHCSGSKCSAQGIYECHDCGGRYTKKPSLRIHIIQKHLNVLPYVCQICGKRSSTKTHHRSHELVHKTERQIYQCHCGAKMRTALGFHMHQRIHSGEKPYECEECGDKFLSASRRLDHIKRKHRSKELAHGCDECGARFVRPSELKKHCRSIHFVGI